ncbi:hypothetical protein DU002_04535 [Corallincola holothuriorum]|uniref:Uncharacterized protein n=1 Tax=Corallincola holothuriorum TaxID=2282215 RepID=A0A368NMC9_9GAMM|nr:hypothetical protein [Corallincola holothuriorum]RCU51742.1 hypothetical protein DU002_04535 [Corallincola holothuriorum]
MEATIAHEYAHVDEAFHLGLSREEYAVHEFFTQLGHDSEITQFGRDYQIYALRRELQTESQKVDLNYQIELNKTLPKVDSLSWRQQKIEME